MQRTFFYHKHIFIFHFYNIRKNNPFLFFLTRTY